jgi:hypothetical protein
VVVVVVVVVVIVIVIVIVIIIIKARGVTANLLYLCPVLLSQLWKYVAAISV